MNLSLVGNRTTNGIIPILLAFPIALAVVLIKPDLSLPLLLGTLVLAVGFLSPELGLYVLVFSMLLGPEVIVGGLGSGTTFGRGVTLRFDDLLIGLVGLGWLARTALSEGTGKFLKTPLNKPIIFYMGACVFATCMGILFGDVNPIAGTFFLLKYYEYFFLFFMTVNIVKTPQQIQRLVIATFITCAAVSLYALAQIPSGIRVSAPFEGSGGEPNTLGGYLVFMMAMASGFLLTEGTTIKKLPLYGLLGISGIALQATLSRASFLAVFVVLFLVLEFVRRRSAKLFGILLICGMLFIATLPGSVVDRVLYTFTQPKVTGQIHVGGFRIDTSTSDRVRSWKLALDQFGESPIWGKGVTGGPFMDAMIPRVLSEAGLLGIVAFLYLLFALFNLGITVYLSTPNPFTKGLSLGFLLGFIGLVIHSIGANTFIIVRIMEPFWLVAALLVKSSQKDQEDMIGLQGDSADVSIPL